MDEEGEGEDGVGGAGADEVGLVGAIDGDADVGRVVVGEWVDVDADLGDGCGATAFADDFDVVAAGGGGVAKCAASEVTYTNEGKLQPAQPAKVTP